MTPKDEPMTPTELEDAIQRLERMRSNLTGAPGLELRKDRQAIDALLSAFREQREALKPFAEFASVLGEFGGNFPKAGELFVLMTRDGPVSITVENLHAAKRALHPEGEG